MTTTRKEAERTRKEERKEEEVMEEVLDNKWFIKPIRKAGERQRDPDTYKNTVQNNEFRTHQDKLPKKRKGEEGGGGGG
jgi:hypothetical protein